MCVGVGSTGTSTGVLTVALALALIQKRRRSRVGRGVGSEVASHICRLLHLSLFFGTRFSLFSRLAGSVAIDLFSPHVPLRRKRPEQQQKRSGLRGYRRAAFSFHKKGRARGHVQVRSIIRPAYGGDRWQGSGKCGGSGVGGGMKVRAGEGEKQEQREARECDQ